jgi:hypothetical protein
MKAIGLLPGNIQPVLPHAALTWIKTTMAKLVPHAFFAETTAMNDTRRLPYRRRLPGLTAVPERVRQAITGLVIDHHGPEFHALVGEIQRRIRRSSDNGSRAATTPPCASPTTRPRPA